MKQPPRNANAFLFVNGRRSCAVEVAAGIEAKLQNNPTVREDFQKAKGDTEFVTDGAFAILRE